MRHLKYLLTLLMLFAMTGSYGQYYVVKYNVNFSLDDCSTPVHRYYLGVFYTNTTGQHELPAFAMDEQRENKLVFGTDTIWADQGFIYGLYATTHTMGKPALGPVWHNDCDPTTTIMYNNPAGDQACIDLTSFDNFECFYSNNCATITNNWFKIFPVEKIACNDPSQLIPLADKVKISASSGFPASAYHWQYSLSAITPSWIDFPTSLMGDSVLNVGAADILGTTLANASINKPILIRSHPCDEGGSDTITLSIRKDAPHILNTTTQSTTCFDSPDGKATIHFDRNLVVNEKLSIIINRLDTANNVTITVPIGSNQTILPGNAYQTPSILTPGKYAVQLAGTYFANGQNAATYTGNLQTHYDTFYINKPPAVAFTKTSADVWCYNGDDGRIDINATGGVGNYKYRLFSPVNDDTTWYNFNAVPQQHITGQTQGTYFVKIKDGNGCVAKTNGGLGVEITDTSVIHQPLDSIHVNLVEQQQPTAYGFTDGYIHIAVHGGTPSSTGTYSYTWINSANTPVTTDSAYVLGGEYHIWLKHIGADQYTVTIRDHQYANATNKTGCEQIRTYIIEQPLPLKVTLELTSLPSCNKNNTHLDPYQDGILTAHAEGGSPFTSGLPYVYTWKKKDANNNWVLMPAYTDSVASGLEEGWYAINVKDAHGIQLGQYQGNVLIQLTDSTIYMPDHALLTINEIVTPVTCNASPTGGIVSNVAGGVPPYQYQWNTGANTPDLAGIAAGGYFLYVTDDKGCHATEAMNVPEPDGYVLTVDTVPPTCNNGCDGSITLNLTGGTQPYTYVWQHTSANSNFVNNLCAGTYTVNISDANNCSFSRIITLSNPPLMPQQATVLESEDNFVRFTVNDTGTYAVTLRTGVNACREEQTKNVIVISPDKVPGSNNTLPPFIEDVKVLPNPNDGHFTVSLKLRESAPADIRIVSVLSSTVVVQRNVSGQKAYYETFDISMLSAGTYLLSVETRKERRTIKIIVQ